MKVFPQELVPAMPVQMEGAVGCRMRRLIGSEEGAQRFTMRLFELDPNGHTPLHQHDYEHEVFVLEGTGQVMDGQQQVHCLQPGTVVFIPPNEMHQFRNTGDGPLRFLCLIPHQTTPVMQVLGCR
ncbi:MAG: cupin domain-containing protein [Thermoguttaceae bacterium]|nr:cupin domain-containing protein [Thermoguttaceae bacterium]MDW8037281.1 cupin domain-containing protein [Thermoguttaceae bacterium]